MSSMDMDKVRQSFSSPDDIQIGMTLYITIQTFFQHMSHTLMDEMKWTALDVQDSESL